MIGKIFITSSGYDPELGRQVHDPYLGPRPTLGACRPDIRRQLKEGDEPRLLLDSVERAWESLYAEAKKPATR